LIGVVEREGNSRCLPVRQLVSGVNGTTGITRIF
jgi:hypothetical protein